MGGSSFNMIVPQGTTFSTTFSLRHRITTIAPALAGDVSLQVAPLAHTIASGSALTFGAISVTTTAEAEIGDRTLSIEPLSSPIPSGATAKGSLVDLTGQQARASIRRQYADPEPLADFDCSISGSEITIALSSEVSESLPANISPSKANRIENLNDLGFPSPNELKLFFPGQSFFVYDVETFDVGGNVKRWIYGKVLVTAEATK
jgi:hypothetical protein